MNWYITNGGCGTDNNFLIHDLKTLRGVIDRFMQYHAKPGNYKIYKYTNIYDDKTHKLMGTVNR